MLSQKENMQGPNQHQEIMIGRSKIIKLDLPEQHFKPNCRNSKESEDTRHRFKGMFALNTSTLVSILSINIFEQVSHEFSICQSPLYTLISDIPAFQKQFHFIKISIAT